jgi:glycosyltransferase involved in cell wall biosynthesis
MWPAVSRLDVEVRILGTDYNRLAAEPAQFPGMEAEFFQFKRAALPVRAWNLLTHCYHERPHCHALAQRVDEVVASWKPDVVHAEELRMANYLPCMRGRRIEAIESVTIHNVESELFEKIGTPAVPCARPLFKRIQLRALQNFEARVAARTDLRFAFSVADRIIYERLFPKVSWLTTRNGADALGIQPSPQPSEPSMFMVASWSYAPNRQGLLWFLESIAPRLMPGAKLTVAGSGADAELRRRLAEAGVRFVDTPIDLKPLYAEHALIVVPLLEGSGTRGKILEAQAHERLVVTTPKGVEGLEIQEGQGVLIAADAEAMARRINEALASFEMRSALARRGREAVIAKYDWMIVAAELKEAWNVCVSH